MPLYINQTILIRHPRTCVYGVEMVAMVNLKDKGGIQ